MRQHSQIQYKYIAIICNANLMGGLLIMYAVVAAAADLDHVNFHFWWYQCVCVVFLVSVEFYRPFGID